MASAGFGRSLSENTTFTFLFAHYVFPAAFHNVRLKCESLGWQPWAAVMWALLYRAVLFLNISEVAGIQWRNNLRLN